MDADANGQRRCLIRRQASSARPAQDLHDAPLVFLLRGRQTAEMGRRGWLAPVRVSDRCRRILPVPARSGGGRLTEPTPSPPGSVIGLGEHRLRHGQAERPHVPFGSILPSVGATRDEDHHRSAHGAGVVAREARPGTIEAPVFLDHAVQPETQIPEFLSADRFSIGRVDPAQSPRRIDSPCRYATSARALSSGNVQLPIGCCTIKNG